MLAGITCMIGGEDLKLHVVVSFRKNRSPLEETWLTGIGQGESLCDLTSSNPLPPNFQPIRVPETSGNDGTSSEHFYLSPDKHLPGLLNGRFGIRRKDVDN